MIIKQDVRPHKMIWVTFRKEGIHKYPAAATDPNLATGDEYDVSFLANPHRHIFHFRVWLSVTHNDRDVEFIQFKRWLEKLYSSNEGVLSLDYKSCEMMSLTISTATWIFAVSSCVSLIPHIYTIKIMKIIVRF